MKFIYLLCLFLPIVLGQYQYQYREIPPNSSNKKLNVKPVPIVIPDAEADVRAGLITRISCSRRSGYPNLWDIKVFSVIPNKDVVNYFNDGVGEIEYDYLINHYVKTYALKSVSGFNEPAICNDKRYLRA